MKIKDALTSRDVDKFSDYLVKDSSFLKKVLDAAIKNDLFKKFIIEAINEELTRELKFLTDGQLQGLFKQLQETMALVGNENRMEVKQLS